MSCSGASESTVPDKPVEPDSVPGDGDRELRNCSSSQLGLYCNASSMKLSSHVRLNRLSTSSPQHAEKVYARAILSALPQGARDPEWKNGVKGAAKPLLEHDCSDSLASELLMELVKYQEVFGYLARLYQSALKIQSVERMDLIVQRGKEILAAVRLLSQHPQVHRYPAAGTEARNSSQVSGLGWKPMRELALAEKVSERRRLRATEARDAKRNLRSAHRNINSCPTAPGPNLPTKEHHGLAKLLVKTIISNEDPSARRGAVDIPANPEKAGYLEKPLKHAGSAPSLTTDNSEFEVHPSTLAQPAVSVCRSESIRWHIPEYDYDGYNVPIMDPPDTLYDHSIGSSSNDRSQRLSRVEKTKRSIAGLSTPYHVRPSSSGNISPKTPSPIATWGPPSAEDSQSTDVPVSPVQETVIIPFRPQRIERAEFVGRPRILFRHSYSHESKTPSSSKMRKLKGVFKNVPIPNLRRLPWSLGSRRSSSGTPSSSGAQDFSSTPPAETFAGTTWPKGAQGSIRPKAERRAISEIATITLISNTTTTSETVGQPVMSSSEEGDRSPNAKTRTEEEYQQVVATVELLKRDLRQERDLNRKSSRGRSRSRGRKTERSLSAFTPRLSESSNRDQVERWLGGTEV